MLNYFRKQADSGLKLLGLIAIIVVAAYLVFRFVDMKIIEKRTLEENNIIFDKLRSTAKLVVWEQDFKLMNIT
ncbi:MAG TPA: hypothetical protein PKN21_07605, partial [Bacteroidales bacterium]|nr:hypothetical protein [Bacteroidales bacterium]